MLVHSQWHNAVSHTHQAGHLHQERTEGRGEVNGTIRQQEHLGTQLSRRSQGIQNQKVEPRSGPSLSTPI
ncbi:MAG: hypothetical protein II403_02890, partial [Prevotella sp.]|nr:hypothetical protein [Prevotella sp.]